MSFSSVSGKNWLFKKFDSSDVTKFSESYALTETVAKLLSIRKKNIEDIRKKFEVPVFNIYTFIEWFQSGLLPTRFNPDHDDPRK